MLDAHYKGKINISDYWAVGDSRTENMNEVRLAADNGDQPDQSMNLVIIGFDHDQLENKIGVKNNAALTIRSSKALLQTDKMNTTYSGEDDCKWSKCIMRSWCNDSFYNAITTDLSNLMKPVIKLSTLITDSEDVTETTIDKVFILSEAEVLSVTELKDGNIYDYFRNNKVDLNPKPWTRTSLLRSNNEACFYYVSGYTTDGDGYTQLIKSNSNSGVAPAFCL